MYIVTITNNGKQTIIHGEREWVQSGRVAKGINTIDSLSFSLLPSNIGFDAVHEFSTLIDVYNTNRDRYEFNGRVLLPQSEMDESGLITKTVTCESIFGYFCDSQQRYVAERNWTARGLFKHLIDSHNAQVEESKRFVIGEVTIPNDSLYIGISRECTWDAIRSNLLDKVGGELRYRVENGVNYIDYLTEVGEVKETAIELSVNMKSITRRQDPTEFVTRLIPLGAKLNDDSEARLDISSVNGGLDYIDDEEAIAAYGIHVGYVEFDDVTKASALLNKGRAWMTENNKIKVKYTATALELSLIGLAFDDFDVHNYHPIINGLLGIDDTARIIKKTIDICDEVQSTIEFGDNFKTLSDIQREQAEQLKSNLQNSLSSVANLNSGFVNLGNELDKTNNVVLEVTQNKYDAAKLTASGFVEFGHDELTAGTSKEFDWQKYLLLVFTLGNSDGTLSTVAGCHTVPSAEFAATSESRLHSLQWSGTNCKVYKDAAGSVYAKAETGDSGVFLRVFGMIEI